MGGWVARWLVDPTGVVTRIHTYTHVTAPATAPRGIGPRPRRTPRRALRRTPSSSRVCVCVCVFRDCILGGFGMFGVCWMNLYHPPPPHPTHQPPTCPTPPQKHRVLPPGAGAGGAEGLRGGAPLDPGGPEAAAGQPGPPAAGADYQGTGFLWLDIFGVLCRKNVDSGH